MASSFNSLLIVLTVFDMVFIFFTVVDYSLARGIGWWRCRGVKVGVHGNADMEYKGGRGGGTMIARALVPMGAVTED